MNLSKLFGRPIETLQELNCFRRDLRTASAGAVRASGEVIRSFRFVVSLRRAHSHAAGFDGDDCASREHHAVAFEDQRTGGSLVTGGNRYEPDNPRVRLCPDDRNFAEVLIQRDEYSILQMRTPEKLFIAGIYRPVAGVDHVVT